MSLKRGDKSVKKSKSVKENKLKAINRKLKHSFDNSEKDINNLIPLLLSGAFFTYDFSSEEFYSHPSLNLLLANILDSDKISQKLIEENLHPEDRPLFNELFVHPRVIPKKLNFQFRIIPKKKELREVQSFALRGFYSSRKDASLLLICSIRNISRDSKSIRDLQRQLEKKEESDRIKTLFLLNISHNIRTPMNSILGFAELLSMTDPGPERRKEFIDVIKKQSKNLLQLIDDVAEIAKFESGKMTVTKSPLNLNVLLNETLKDIEAIQSSSRKEQVKVFLNLPNQTGLEMFSDSGRIHQIILNIVGHSLKYTVAGSIEVGYTLPDDGKVDFYVRDTSENVNKEELKLILDKYIHPANTFENRYDEETGLNLSIAKSIVKLMGGKLSFESTPEGGIIFNFRLPYEAVPTVEPEMVAAEAQLHEQYKWTDRVILIVEDEEVNGLFLEAVFQETGAQTLFAKNGHQAVDLCRSMSGKIDLVLMDIRMPVMNGLKATQEIRKFDSHLPIIAQTALATQEDRDQCMAAGCTDTVTKPIEIEHLLHMVNTHFT